MVSRRDVIRSIGSVAGIATFGATTAAASDSLTLEDSMYRATRRGYDIRLESRAQIYISNCEAEIYWSANVDILSLDDRDHEGTIEFQSNDVFEADCLLGEWCSNSVEFNVKESTHGDDLHISRYKTVDDFDADLSSDGEINHEAIVNMDDGYSTNLIASDEGSYSGCV